MYQKLTIAAVILFVSLAAQSQSTGIPAVGHNARANAEGHPRAINHCAGAAAMTANDFAAALASVKGQAFDEAKLSSARQIAGSNCLTTGQIAEICMTFGFEENKLSFAKFAYDYCVEPRNYFKLNSVFGFSSSVDELNKYVESKE
jgi:Domain of unknown function (DUF4476)